MGEPDGELRGEDICANENMGGTFVACQVLTHFISQLILSVDPHLII